MTSTGESKPAPDLRIADVLAEYYRRISQGERVGIEQLSREFPELGDQIDGYFSALHEASTAAPIDSAATAAQSAGQQPVPSFAAVGNYELVEEIARGAMGVVYKARQVTNNQIVALKMILAGQMATEQQIRRFQSEAELIASLDHPNIVTIRERGLLGGLHYFAMDFVKGQSLAELVREGPLAETQAAEYCRIIAEAVDYAHRNGILHRDLKPSNVLLDGSGCLHITDFGLAKRMEAEQDLTATGAILGTPSYMPPEQTTGGKAKLGPQSDVYGVGAILYTLITGRPPFRGDTALDTLLLVLERDPVLPTKLNPDLSPDLEVICLKCLRKKPEDRYSSAAEIVAELSRFLAGEPIRTTPQNYQLEANLTTSEEVAVARKVQQCLLPRELPSLPGWQFAATCRVADTIAGDYYDIFEVAPGQIAVTLGDVSITGLGASLVMAGLHAMIRSRFPQNREDLADLLCHVNEYLLLSTPNEVFVTLFLALLETDQGTLRFANAGHPSPILISGTERSELTAGGPILGILPDACFVEDQVFLPRASVTTLYSNGLTGACNEQGDLLNRSGAIELLQSVCSAPAPRIVDGLMESVVSFAGCTDLGDDVSLIVIKRS